MKHKIIQQLKKKKQFKPKWALTKCKMGNIMVKIIFFKEKLPKGLF